MAAVVLPKMFLLYLALAVAQGLAAALLGRLVLPASPLARRALATAPGHDLVQTFAERNLSGLGCLRTLNASVSHVTYKLILCRHRPGGSFMPGLRWMVVGRDSYGKQTPSAVLDAAHEFVHVTQTGPAWRLVQLIGIIGLTATLGAFATIVVDPTGPWVIALEALGLSTHTFAKIRAETDAALRAPEFADRYLADTLLPPDALCAWRRYASRRAFAELAWRPLTELHDSIFLGAVLTTLALLSVRFSAPLLAHLLGR